jgi:hypothetical protein
MTQIRIEVEGVTVALGDMVNVAVLEKEMEADMVGETE